MRYAKENDIESNGEKNWYNGCQLNFASVGDLSTVSQWPDILHIPKRKPQATTAGPAGLTGWTRGSEEEGWDEAVLLSHEKKTSQQSNRECTETRSSRESFSSLYFYFSLYFSNEFWACSDFYRCTDAQKDYFTCRIISGNVTWHLSTSAGECLQILTNMFRVQVFV